MPIGLQVKSDIKDLRRRLSRDQKVLLPKVLNQAINKTMDNAYAKAASVVGKEAGIKVSIVKSRMRKDKSNRRSLTAYVEAFGGKFNLARFKAKETAKGISAKVWGQQRVFKGAFFAFGKKTVFRRESEKRLPIRPLYGPSVPGALSQDKIEKAVQDRIEEQWPKNLESAARRYWAKR